MLRIVGEECGKRVIRNEGISLLAGDLFSSSGASLCSKAKGKISLPKS